MEILVNKYVNDLAIYTAAFYLRIFMLAYFLLIAIFYSPWILWVLCIIFRKQNRLLEMNRNEREDRNSIFAIIIKL